MLDSTKTQIRGKLRSVTSLQRGLIISLLPLSLLALWGINWRILHPAPTDSDLRVRALLKETDRVEVKIEYFKKGAGRWGETVLRLSPAQTRSVVEDLNLSATPWQRMMHQDYPVVYLKFFQRENLRAEIFTSYNARKYNFFVEHPVGHPEIVSASGALRFGSALRLRQFLGAQPEVTRALLRVGAQTKNLAPRAFIPEGR